MFVSYGWVQLLAYIQGARAMTPDTRLNSRAIVHRKRGLSQNIYVAHGVELLLGRARGVV